MLSTMVFDGVTDIVLQATEEVGRTRHDRMLIIEYNGGFRTEIVLHAERADLLTLHANSMQRKEVIIDV